jgi:gluconolactonase
MIFARFSLLFLCGLVACVHAAAATRAVLADAVVDLRTSAGAALVNAQWRYHDARLVEVDHRLPGPGLKPTGAPVRTHDIHPKAGAVDFDDSGWERLSADSLEARRSTGRFALGWYRLTFTVPETLDGFTTRGSTAVLELVVDDYAEVWVNGRLSPVLGSTGGAFPSGWNSVQRVVVGRDVRPGEPVQIAIFAANGPLSNPPENYIWLRSATLDFYRPERARIGEPVAFQTERLEPGLDAIMPYGAVLEKLADGFAFTEGPVWVPNETGYLLFSDPNNNRIYRWSREDGAVSVYRTKSGYSGVDIGKYRQPGSNGLALDREGRLTIAEHGNRRIPGSNPMAR